MTTHTYFHGSWTQYNTLWSHETTLMTFAFLWNGLLAIPCIGILGFHTKVDPQPFKKNLMEMFNYQNNYICVDSNLLLSLFCTMCNKKKDVRIRFLMCAWSNVVWTYPDRHSTAHPCCLQSTWCSPFCWIRRSWKNPLSLCGSTLQSTLNVNSLRLSVIKIRAIGMLRNMYSIISQCSNGEVIISYVSSVCLFILSSQWR